MAVSIEDIKRLRELSGVGMTDAKKALDAANGDFDQALAEMRKKGMTKAEKKGEREAREGVVEGYVHSGRIGVLVELNCETDFVTRTNDFKALAHDIAMHVAASAPEYVSADQIPETERTRARAEFTDKAVADGKKTEMIDQIVEGQLQKYFAERCLLDQPFIKNPDISVGQHVKEHVAKLGENIVVRRFSRIALGELG